MIKSGFMQALLSGGVPDRVYSASEYANRWGNFVSKGIAIPGGGELAGENEVSIVAASFNTSIAIGRGWIVNDEKDGYDYDVTAPEEVTHSAADPTNPRIDRIVLELNLTEGSYGDPTTRAIIAKVVEGTPAASPTAPALTRTSTIYQISLAQILIPANVGSLDTATLTDERSDDVLCGVSNIVLGITPPSGDAEVEKNTITRLVWNDTGATDAYVVDTQGTFDIVQGNQLSFIAANNNTGAATVAIDGQTALNIKDVDDAGVKQDPEADRIIAGQKISGYIDSGFFVLAPISGGAIKYGAFGYGFTTNAYTVNQLIVNAAGKGMFKAITPTTSSGAFVFYFVLDGVRYPAGSEEYQIPAGKSIILNMPYESTLQVYVNTATDFIATYTENDKLLFGTGKSLSGGLTLRETITGSGRLLGVINNGFMNFEIDGDVMFGSVITNGMSFSPEGMLYCDFEFETEVKIYSNTVNNHAVYQLF